jgi:hypothetical protein
MNAKRRGQPSRLQAEFARVLECDCSVMLDVFAQLSAAPALRMSFASSALRTSIGRGKNPVRSAAKDRNA